jgi:hypothetical protein
MLEVSDRIHTVAATRARRIGAGISFLASAIVAAAVLAGIGFAGTAPSAAQYQYGKKVAICHHTASKTHPWVTLVIDIHAWPAHLQHGDTLGSCAGTQTPGKTHDGKVAVCHYTGSKTRPWVTLRINIHAWPAHLQHGDHLGPCGESLPPPPVQHQPKPKGAGSDGGHGRNK